MHDLFAAAELNVFFGMRLGKVADGLFFLVDGAAANNGSIACVFIYAGNPHDSSPRESRNICFYLRGNLANSDFHAV